MKPLIITTLTMIASACMAQPLSPNEAVRTAFENRPAVAAAQLRVEEANKKSLALAAYPPLTFGFGYSTSDLGNTDEDLFLNQPFDIFGQTSAKRAVGKALVALAETELRQAKLEVQTEVLNRFFQATSARRVSQVADQLVELARSLEHAAARRFDEGRIPEIQVLRSSIEVEKAVQTANLHKNEAQAALVRLAASLGQPEPPFELQLDAVLAPLDTPDFQSRPNLLLLKNRSDLALAEATVAKRSNRPELALVATRSPWRSPGSEYGARLQLTWSLLDYGKSRHDTLSHQLASKSILASHEDSLKKATAEYQALTVELEGAQAQLSSYQTLRESARLLAAKSQRGYDEGVGTHIDVLESTRTLREIEETIAKIGLNVHLVEIARYRAAGHLLEDHR